MGKIYFTGCGVQRTELKIQTMFLAKYMLNLDNNTFSCRICVTNFHVSNANFLTVVISIVFYLISLTGKLYGSMGNYVVRRNMISDTESIGLNRGEAGSKGCKCPQHILSN